MCANFCKHDSPLTFPKRLVFLKTDRYLDTFPCTLAFMLSAECLTLRIVAKIHGYLITYLEKIMDTSYKHYMKLTPNQLHTRLLERKTPPFQAEHIKRIVAEQQALHIQRTLEQSSLPAFGVSSCNPLKLSVTTCKVCCVTKVAKMMRDAKPWKRT